MKYFPPRYLFRRYEVIRRIRKGDQFLEVGPGNLGLAQELLGRFDKGTLIDFNTTDTPRIYEELGEPQKRRLQLIIADFSQHDRWAQKFDCLVACEVLEHVEDDRGFLRKTYGLLTDGGQLVLSVPARMRFWAVDDEIAGHFRRYERDGLRSLLEEAGYSGVKIISYGFPFQNLVRQLRLGVARRQYKEKAAWDKKKQTQESGFLLKRSPLLNLAALAVNKYTIYPFAAFASIFNGLDLGEGYLACATKPGG